MNLFHQTFSVRILVAAVLGLCLQSAVADPTPYEPPDIGPDPFDLLHLSTIETPFSVTVNDLDDTQVPFMGHNLLTVRWQITQLGYQGTLTQAVVDPNGILIAEASTVINEVTYPTGGAFGAVPIGAMRRSPGSWTVYVLDQNGLIGVLPLAVTATVPGSDTDGDSVPDILDVCHYSPPYHRWLAPFWPGGPYDSTPSVGIYGCSWKEVDIDGDGFCDSAYTGVGPYSCTGVDNCKFVSNPDQADFNGDGEGDACEGIESLIDDLSVSKNIKKAKLTWTPPTYNIYRSDTPGGPYELVAANHKTKLGRFIDRTATVGSTYYYVVAPILGGVESNPSNEIEVTIMPREK